MGVAGRSTSSSTSDRLNRRHRAAISGRRSPSVGDVHGPEGRPGERPHVADGLGGRRVEAAPRRGRGCSPARPDSDRAAAQLTGQMPCSADGSRRSRPSGPASPRSRSTPLRRTSCRSRSTRTTTVAHAPDRVDRRCSAATPGRGPALAPDLQPVPDHAGLRQRERGEHADHVQLDQACRRWRRRPRSARPARRPARHPVREHEPVAPVLELAGEEAVPGQDRGQSRGKSWNDVFAARIRMAEVNIWTAKNRRPPPKTAVGDLRRRPTWSRSGMRVGR